MRENNKNVLTVVVAVILAVLFISCSVAFNKVYGTKKDDNVTGEIKLSVPGFDSALAFTDTGETFDGVENIYKTVLKDGRSVYLVTAKYYGFSQKAVIGACFEGSELLSVTVISKEGIPSYYDDRALGKEYLSNFSGTIPTDPKVKLADRKFMEIEMLSENDRAGSALLESVDNCCLAYYETILNKTVGNNG